MCRFATIEIARSALVILSAAKDLSPGICGKRRFFDSAQDGRSVIPQKKNVNLLLNLYIIIDKVCGRRYTVGRK